MFPAISQCVQVGLVSFFLPFFPLERRHLRQLFELRLRERSAELQRAQLGGLQWDAAVLDFLLSKVRRSRALWAPAGGGSRAGQGSSLRWHAWAPGCNPNLYVACRMLHANCALTEPPLRRSTLTETFQ